MSLLIKGLNLPEKIEGEMVFEFIDDMSGKRYARIYDYKFGGLINCCEVVSIPPHGDLIDRDALIEHMETEADNFEPLDMYEVGMLAGYNAAIRTIRENALPIIPAEEERKKHETAFRHTERV